MSCVDVPLRDLKTTTNSQSSRHLKEQHLTKASTTATDEFDTLKVQEQIPRRRPSTQGRPSRVRGMSLVGLKDIFFQQTTVKVKKNESRGLLNSK